jgi:hypothetical protein
MESMDNYLITPAECDELHNRFSYHAPHGNQAERYEAIRDAAYLFAERICELAPNSGERTLAIRDVQAAVMWANAAIALREPPGETSDDLTGEGS